MFAAIHSDVVSWRPHPTARVFTRPHHSPLTMDRWSAHDEDAYSALVHGRTAHYKRPGAHILVGVGRTRVVAVLGERGFLRVGRSSQSATDMTHENVRRNDPAIRSVSPVTLQRKTVHLSSMSGEGAHIAALLSEAGVGTIVSGDGRCVSAGDISASRYRCVDFGAPRLEALQYLLDGTGTAVRAGGVSEADLSIALTEQSPGTAWMEPHYDDVPYVLYHVRADSAILAGVYQRHRREPMRCEVCSAAAPRELSPMRRGRSPVAAVGAALAVARAVEFLISPVATAQHVTVTSSGGVRVLDEKNAVWCMC